MRGQRYVTEEQRIQAFEAKYIPEPNTGCWLWTGSRCRDGYGNFYDGSRVIGAHRFSWSVHKGQAPGKFHVLHKCDTPACVNPDHLKLGTHTDNMRDSRLKGRHVMANKTLCKRGHALADDNLYIVSGGGRGCRACRKMMNKDLYVRKQGEKINGFNK